MEIRADLTSGATVLPSGWSWRPSPEPGVARVMLDRVGDEVAVATSFVRYAPGSKFGGHQHALGEEFLVLEGEFGDEAGRYPEGSYVRNPPGSSHAPFSDTGCLIWVKLRQFQTDDDRQLVASLDLPLPAAGQQRRVLHEHGEEQVAELVAASGETITLEPRSRPQELLVLEGSILEGEQQLPRWSWRRWPAGRGTELYCSSPCRLFWKTRPLD